LRGVPNRASHFQSGLAHLYQDNEGLVTNALAYYAIVLITRIIRIGLWSP